MYHELSLNQLKRLCSGSAELGAAQFTKSIYPKKDLISKGKAIMTFGNDFIEDMYTAKEISGTILSRVKLLTLLYGKYIYTNYGL